MNSIRDFGEVQDIPLQLLAWWVSSLNARIISIAIKIPDCFECCSHGVGGLCSNEEEQKVLSFQQKLS